MGLLRLMWHCLGLAEVGLSTFIHISYGVFIICTALLGDLYCHLRGHEGLMKASAVPLSTSSRTGATILAAQGKCLDLPAAAAMSTSLLGALAPLDSNHIVKPNDAPIVLVHGIFGFGEGKLGSLSYWGGIEREDKKVLVPDLGSLASVHDRACELFYYLKGGVIDFGKEHSHKCGHDRFGRACGLGQYPEWDEDHPVHFVAHSSGVQAVRMLQTMLAEKSFEDHTETSADWISSVTSLSGALNGTTRVYLDGISFEDGRSLRWFSLLQVLRFGVLFYEWLAPRLLKKYYSFGFDHFRMHWTECGIWGLLTALLGLSGPFAYGDWIVPDLSIQSTAEMNRALKTYPGTYYFSYATVKTKRFLGRTIPASPAIHPLLFLRTVQIGIWRHPPAHAPPYESYRDEDWQHNDGALNTISMLYPMLPRPHPHCPLSAESRSGQSLKPGIWYYTLLDADHVYFIINRKRAGPDFDVLYHTIFQRCRQQLGARATAQIEAFCRDCKAACSCSPKSAPPTPGDLALPAGEATAPEGVSDCSSVSEMPPGTDQCCSPFTI